MKRLACAIFFSTTLVSVLYSSSVLAQSEEHTTVIHAGTLLARADEAPSQEQSIIIVGDRIEAIEEGYVER